MLIFFVHCQPTLSNLSSNKLTKRNPTDDYPNQNEKEGSAFSRDDFNPIDRFKSWNFERNEIIDNHQQIGKRTTWMDFFGSKSSSSSSNDDDGGGSFGSTKDDDDKPIEIKPTKKVIKKTKPKGRINKGMDHKINSNNSDKEQTKYLEMMDSFTKLSTFKKKKRSFNTKIGSSGKKNTNQEPEEENEYEEMMDNFSKKKKRQEEEQGQKMENKRGFSHTPTKGGGYNEQLGNGN